MSTYTPEPDLRQDCLQKLNRALDLVLQTAETASAAGNHKVVIQAAREVTRMVTLITKITDPKVKSKPQPGLLPLGDCPGSGKAAIKAPSAVTNQQKPPPPAKADPGGRRAAKSRRINSNHLPAETLPNLEKFFRGELGPGDQDSLDPISLEILRGILE